MGGPKPLHVGSIRFHLKGNLSQHSVFVLWMQEKSCAAEQPWAGLAERHPSGAVRFDWHMVKQ